jgi:flagellar M-ring protein FliF
LPDLSRLRDVWRHLSSGEQLTIVVSALLVVVTIFGVYRYSSHASYSTLVSGLDPTSASQATKDLQGAGITYHLGSGGTSIAVKDSDAAAARLAIAKDGSLPGSHVGFEIFDKKSLGITDFQQQVDYQRALEGEVARTIEQIDGVSSADVQLVMPQDSLFADSSPKASAAVLITTSGLDNSTVRGIAHLVASSVKGLSTDAVTITDSSGTLLWPSASSGDGANAGSRLAAEQQYDNQLAGQINALLVSTLGAGKAQARVHADLSLDQSEVATVTYGKTGTPLQSQTDTETLGTKGSTATPKGAAGTASNVPNYAATTGGTGNGTSNYNHKTDATTFGVDKTVKKTTFAPGTVNKLDVALLVDKSVPTAEVTSLKQAVSSMAGLDTKRGDTIAVSTVSFAKPAAVAKKGSPLDALPVPLSALKNVGIGLGAILFLALMARSLRKREKDGVAPDVTWLREVETSWPLREIEAAPTMRMEVDPEQQRRAALRGDVEEITRGQPDQIALQVSQWMQD